MAHHQIEIGTVPIRTKRYVCQEINLRTKNIPKKIRTKCTLFSKKIGGGLKTGIGALTENFTAGDFMNFVNLMTEGRVCSLIASRSDWRMGRGKHVILLSSLIESHYQLAESTAG